MRGTNIISWRITIIYLAIIDWRDVQACECKVSQPVIRTSAATDRQKFILIQFNLASIYTPLFLLFIVVGCCCFHVFPFLLPCNPSAPDMFIHLLYARVNKSLLTFHSTHRHQNVRFINKHGKCVMNGFITFQRDLYN